MKGGKVGRVVEGSYLWIGWVLERTTWLRGVVMAWYGMAWCAVVRKRRDKGGSRWFEVVWQVGKGVYRTKVVTQAGIYLES